MIRKNSNNMYPSLNINWFNGSCLMQNPIQEMFEYRDVISDADLLLLLGKIKLRKHVRSSRHYNRLILGPEVDIALQELKRRKNEKWIPWFYTITNQTSQRN